MKWQRENWFAWHPIRVGGRWTWLRTVQRWSRYYVLPWFPYFNRERRYGADPS